MASRFEEVVAHQPDRLAVKAGGRSLTYGELNDRANGVAAVLLEHGGRRDQCVALLPGDRLEAVASYLGAFKTGRPAVHLDRSAPPERLAAILADACPVAIVAGPATEDRARSLGASAGIRVVLPPGTARTGPFGLAGEIGPDAPAVILYTSGSTGDAKGVVQGQRLGLFSALFHREAQHLDPEDRYAVLAPPGFAQFLEAMHATLLNGAAFFPVDVEREGLAAVRDLLLHERITVYQSVPALFRAFLRSLPRSQRFPAVRVVRIGGDRVVPEDVALFTGRFGEETVLRVGYASSEAGPISFETIDPRLGTYGGPVSAGRPHPLVEVSIVDADLRSVPPGETGEIAVQSPGLALGYWNRPDLTWDRFRQGAPGEQTFLTRDLGRRLPDGRLLLLGRADESAKVRGVRVDLTEVEQALRRVPGVVDAAARVHEMPDGSSVLAGYFVDSGSEPGPDLIRRSLSERLPDSMVPSRIVRLASIPLTERGKVDRAALPLPAAPATGSGGAREGLEESIVRVCAGLLGLDQVHPEANLSDLGWDSLMALRAALELEGALHQFVSPSTFLEAGTVRDLASALSGQARAEPWTVVPLRTGGVEPPLFFIHPAGGEVLVYTQLVRRLEPDRPVYGLRRERSPDGSPRFTRVEEMASSYAAAIREVWPDGPYLLAGVSVGGTIAFEMARQLSSSGATVSLVVLLDPRLPLGTVPVPAGLETSPRAAWRRATNRVSYHASAWSLLQPEERLPFVRERLANHLSGRAAAKSRRGEAEWFPGQAERSVRHRYDPHRPGRYDGRVILARARLQPVHHARDLTFGFGEAIRGPIEVHEIPGEHALILQEPFVRALAPIVSDALRRAT